jgi:serine/threonine protein kinase
MMLYYEPENEITGGVGTKIYASPEQWEGNKEKFDYKADIYSLGIIFLLLFHPMDTSMEQLRVINDSKNGKLPLELEKNLLEIAAIVRRMLAFEADERPAIEVILPSLRLPVEISTQFSGKIYLRREDSLEWECRHFKLIDDSLYVFGREQDKKAENVYNLSEWSVSLKSGENADLSNYPDQKDGSEEAWIALEDPMRLGWALKGENAEQTVELFSKFGKPVA